MSHTIIVDQRYYQEFAKFRAAYPSLDNTQLVSLMVNTLLRIIHDKVVEIDWPPGPVTQ